MTALPTYLATRYLQPLREGGSLPAVVDTAGGGLFVVKFRGAGQGTKALVAEVVVGLLAREAGLAVPEIALVEIEPPFGNGEPDPEIQDLLRMSHGTNVGLRFLDGAFNFAASAAGDLVDAAFASDLVWLDAFVTNPDRTHRNTNLLVWERRPWLIDHGAALYAHHAWAGVTDERTRAAFPLIRDHVLLAQASELEASDARLGALFTEERIAAVLAAVPDSLLTDPTGAYEFGSADAARERYVRYLTLRAQSPRAFATAAVEARETVLREPPRPLRSRR